MSPIGLGHGIIGIIVWCCVASHMTPLPATSTLACKQNGGTIVKSQQQQCRGYAGPGAAPAAARQQTGQATVVPDAHQDACNAAFTACGKTVTNNAAGAACEASYNSCMNK
jgi:hypothetical protein